MPFPIHIADSGSIGVLVACLSWSTKFIVSDVDHTLIDDYLRVGKPAIIYGNQQPRPAQPGHPSMATFREEAGSFGNSWPCY